jgi:hypothetical protein
MECAVVTTVRLRRQPIWSTAIWRRAILAWPKGDSQMPRDWKDELDEAARANLSERGQSAYRAYRDQLIQENEPDAELILSGFIWDESESESLQDN